MRIPSKTIVITHQFVRFKNYIYQTFQLLKEELLYTIHQYTTNYIRKFQHLRKKLRKLWWDTGTGPLSHIKGLHLVVLNIVVDEELLFIE